MARNRALMTGVIADRRVDPRSSIAGRGRIRPVARPPTSHHAARDLGGRSGMRCPPRRVRVGCDQVESRGGSAMSKAVRFEEYGGIDVLKVVEVERPVPGDGEVLVRVKAAGINFGEALIRSG